MDVTKKVPVREQAPDVRNKNFDEVCLGYNEEEAVLEASRCINCKNAQCIKGCPVSINIPAFIHEVKEKNFEVAIRLSVSHQHFRLSADVYVHRKASVKENVSAVSRAKQFLLVSWNVSLLTGQGKIRLSRKNLRKRRIRKLPLLVQVLQVLPVQEILQRWVMT